MGPKSNDLHPPKKREMDIQRHRRHTGRSHVGMEAETGPRAEDSQQPAETKGGKQGPSLPWSLRRELGQDNILISYSLTSAVLDA